MSESIGDRVRRCMDERGWSQRELARKTKFPPSNVQRYLTGGEVPAEFVAACERIGLADSRYLLTGQGAPDLQPEDARDVVERIRALVSPRPSASPDEMLDDDDDFDGLDGQEKRDEG